MDTNESLIKKLSKLAQLDIDAARAYDQALDHIDIPDIKSSITLFQNDHKRHITDLNQQITSLGGKAVEETPDFKGVLIEGFTALRSTTGIAGALKAMRSNEKLTNKTYDDALAEDALPENIRLLIIKNRDDERKHLAYIEKVLQEEPWETMSNT
jgi:uncharacterized protein (TIGR02284 family)